MSGRKHTVWWIVISLIVAVYALFPVLWIVSLSLKSPGDIANKRFWPSAIDWSNYELIFTGSANDLFLPALVNSIGICLIATVIAVSSRP